MIGMRITLSSSLRWMLETLMTFASKYTTAFIALFVGFQLPNTTLSSLTLIFSELEDINDFLFDAFETLEPQVFDFRTPMMRVEIDC